MYGLFTLIMNQLLRLSVSSARRIGTSSNLKLANPFVSNPSRGYAMSLTFASPYDVSKHVTIRVVK